MSKLALKVLNDTFGYEQFRGFQGEVVDELIAGKDALVLMPTGGGKSLCYQVPALVMPGTTVVVSPLIALMQDQISSLQQIGVRAQSLNSGIAYEDRYRIEQALMNGELDMLYVSPERLMSDTLLRMLDQIRVALFAIDEAHCVSQWGHDFRPEYLQLNRLKDRFPGTPRVALTATADQRTREEIIRRLGLDTAKVFIDSFDRANIFYRISQKKQARRQLLRFLECEHADDSGIVYCLSRKRVEETAAWLNDNGRQVLAYHGGMSAEIRKHHQQRFLKEDGLVIVATIAFGMGIDKPDVRFVAHLDLPRSIEAYYQETGRAGRDGLPATAWMVYGLQDVMLLRQIQANSNLNPEMQRLEQQKLNAMLALCEAISCRRQILLAYFGERMEQPCGYCDLCSESIKSWDATEAAQKALSCVYRTGQVFGVSHMVDVLLGKETSKVSQFAHQRLNVFGIGKELQQTQWRSVYRQLVAKGYINVDVEKYGGLRLNSTCRPLLKGEERLLLRQDRYEYESKRVDKQAKQDKKGRLVIEDSDQPMWESLRQLRRSLAEEQGVPAYIIFNDKTLFEMLRILPKTMEEMSCVSGVGQFKLKAYGEQFVSLINDCINASG